MKPLLLAANAPPSGDISDAPRLDFLELARALNADLSYPPPKRGNLISRVEEKTASDFRQAWAAAARRDVGAYVSLSEKAGLPLALLLRALPPRRRKTPHVLVAHHLTSPKKRALQARTGVLHAFDRIVVLCKTQEEYLLRDVGLPAHRVHFVYDKVDHRFWRPLPPSPSPIRMGEGEGGRGRILAVGREQRDYATLIEAVRPRSDWQTVIVSSSPWSRNAGGGGEGQGELPAHVSVVRGLPWEGLRDLYARASVVVVPLHKGTDYAAGVNGVLEAMAMQKPLIVSHTPGIADYVAQQEAATHVVPSGDPQELRDALQFLYENPTDAARLAGNARRIVESGRNLEAYVENLRRIVAEVAAA